MKRLKWYLPAMLAAVALSTVVPMALAEGFPPNSTPIPITSCTTITASGFYVVQNDLTTASGDCIVIAASDVVLSLNGHNITGGGTGAGIHVSKTSSKGSPVMGTFIEGLSTQSTQPGLNGFSAGLLDEADGTFGDNFDCTNNQDGLLLKGKNSNITDFSASNNARAGVHLLGGKNLTVNNFTANNNPGIGMLVENSTGSNVDTYSTDTNGLSGTYVDSKSSHNLLFDFTSSHNASFGVIDAGAQYNLFTNINANSNGVLDLKDENKNCDHNLWFANNFGTADPSSCINNPNFIPITTCAKIAKSGFYTVQNDLTHTSGDCIVIAASNVVLSLNAHIITGGGTGAGIHIKKTTDDGAPVASTFIEGAISAPSLGTNGFGVGLLDEANGSFVDNVGSHNNTEGLLLKGKNSNVSNFEAINNATGVHLLRGTNQTVNTFLSDNNTKFGVLVENASGNNVDSYLTNNNGTAGTYINPSSNHNLLFDCNISSNGSFGIEIDKGSTHDLVTDCGGTSNGITDLKDNNTACDHNLWFGDKFTAADPSSCIH